MDGISSYKEHAVTTQTPGRLIVMLYDGAIGSLHKAIEAMEAEDQDARDKYLNKAQAIIDELNVSLDLGAGGEVARNLRSLYNFMTRHLAQAVARNDPQMVRDVIACLDDLNEGWKAITS